MCASVVAFGSIPVGKTCTGAFEHTASQEQWMLGTKLGNWHSDSSRDSPTVHVGIPAVEICDTIQSACPQCV